MTQTPALDELRELAHRTNDGLQVALFWFKGTNQLVVSVSDERTGERFELPADERNALSVFYHPFAYAAAT